MYLRRLVRHLALALCPAVVPCLKGRLSPADIHYLPLDVRILFFEALDFADPATLHLLLPLVTTPLLDLHLDYQKARLSTIQSRAIVGHYRHNKRAHRVLFPTGMLSTNDDLLAALRPHWNDYEPGLICLTENSAFTAEEKQRLLSGLGAHPELCGNTVTALEARALNAFTNNWEVSADLHGNRWVPPSIIFYLIDSFLYGRNNVDDRLLTRELAVAQSTEAIRMAWREMKMGQQMTKNAEFLLLELQRVYGDFSRQRKVLWEMKLVFVIIILAYRGFRLLGDLQYVEMASLALQALLREHDVEDMPEYILPPLLVEASQLFEIYDPHLYDKLHKLQQRVDPDYCIGGSLETRILAWKKQLHRHVGPPRGLYAEGKVTLDRLLLWWGDYEDLSTVLYQNPQIHPPLVVEHPAISIGDMATLLGLLNPIIMQWIRELGLLKSTVPRTGLTEQEACACRGLARCIAANVLYCHALAPLHVGLDPRNEYDWPFSQDTYSSSPTPCHAILTKALYLQTSIRTYVDYGMLLRAALPSHPIHS